MTLQDTAPARGWWAHPLRPAAPVDDDQVDDDQVASVRTYYLHTWKDYRGLWMNRDNRAMHLGYWDCSVHDHADSLLRSNQVLAGLAAVDRTTRCLDLGAGVGGTAMWMASTFSCPVVGLTLVPDQARRMEAYSAERGLGDRVQPLAGDYHALDFPDASFDVVYAQEAIVHARDPRPVLDEARRVLRPGGRLVFMEGVARGGPTSRAFRTLLETWRMPSILEDGWLRSWAEGAGFASWSLDDITLHVMPSIERLYRLARVTLPMQRGLARLGLRTDVQSANVAGAMALRDSVINGDWYYGAFAGQVASAPPGSS